MRLGVNIDHIATLRQQRKEGFPDPVAAALVAQQNGADSIVAHLREDRRHIQDADLFQLKQKLRIPLAMEMASTDEMVRIARRLRPTRVCLVPEKRQELTTEGGLNLIARRAEVQRHIRALRGSRIEVSVFIDPDLDQVCAAKALGADTVELHTGRYARRKGGARLKELKRLEKASGLAMELGLDLHAGHGLDYENVDAVARLPDMQELNIGFSIVAEMVSIGLGAAVRQMKRRIQA